MAVKTVEARVLLGWMERDAAIRYLREDCYFDPELSEPDAEKLWQKYKDAVCALPERVIVDPARFSLTNAEKTAVNQFRTRNGPDPNVADVIKINPLGLLVHQLYVVTEISDGYSDAVKGSGWLDNTLLAQRRSQFRIRTEPNKIVYEIPHGEFIPEILPTGGLQLREGNRLASASRLDGRMLLGTGYHRSFAYARNAMKVPDAIGKAAVFPLLKSLPFPDSPAAPNHGLRVMLLGPRAPFFADFFDEGLFMSVRLRKKKHYEMRFSIEFVGVDDDAP